MDEHTVGVNIGKEAGPSDSLNYQPKHKNVNCMNVREVEKNPA